MLCVPNDAEWLIKVIYVYFVSVLLGADVYGLVVKEVVMVCGKCMWRVLSSAPTYRVIGCLDQVSKAIFSLGIILVTVAKQFMNSNVYSISGTPHSVLRYLYEQAWLSDENWRLSQVVLMFEAVVLTRRLYYFVVVLLFTSQFWCCVGASVHTQPLKRD